MGVYENVVNLSAKRKMSIRKLESEAGLTQGSISKWKKSSPLLSNAKAVADVLHVKVDKLLE